MAKLDFTEGKVAAREGFAVRFRYEGPAKQKGRDVRGDKTDVPPYTYKRAASGDTTVAAWTETRFKSTYPGYAVEVLDGKGKPVHGKTLLKNVRKSYD